jgi:hypothetical protein
MAKANHNRALPIFPHHYLSVPPRPACAFLYGLMTLPNSLPSNQTNRYRGWEFCTMAMATESQGSTAAAAGQYFRPPTSLPATAL